MNTRAALERRGPILVEQLGRVLMVKINRPEVKNSLNRLAQYAIIRALNDAAHDSNISIVVLTGSGDTFTAGCEPADDEACYRSASVVLRALVKAFICCPKVLVALVNGPCIGVGFALTALCDVVYCTEGAYFQAPFTKLGSCPVGCLSYLLSVALGRSKATEALLFGKKLTAEEAVQFNFVARIFKTKDLDNLFWPTIQEHSLLPQEALRSTKRLLRESDREALFSALQSECQAAAHLDAVELFSYPSSDNKSKL